PFAFELRPIARAQRGPSFGNQVARRSIVIKDFPVSGKPFLRQTNTVYVL
ncbi:MAG: hypothetical protein ACJA0I_001928, partial [Gammaproteobacteria bacterium]